VGFLALIAGTVSYLHMHTLVALDGQPGWVAAMTPLSVDGMIVAASTTLLADSRSGRKGGGLPWALPGRGECGQPGCERGGGRAHGDRAGDRGLAEFALTASYGLLTRQVRRSSISVQTDGKVPTAPRSRRAASRDGAWVCGCADVGRNRATAHPAWQARLGPGSSAAGMALDYGPPWR
jgi:uncharacterized protein DUF2637